MLDLTILRSFVAVYRHGSITRAAEALHLSQPAVSLHLKTLETQLGRPLFTRLARGVAATPAGHDLAHEVTPHLDALAAIAETVQPGSGTLAGTVHLGGPADLLAAKALPALAPLLEQGIRLRTRLGITAALLDDLAHDRLDVVIATQRLPMRGIVFEPLFDEHFVLVGNPRWASRIGLDAVRALGAAALADVPLIAFTDDLPIIRRYFRTVFNAAVTGGAAVTVEDLRAVLATVVAGGGISVLPSYLCREQVARGELVVLATPAEPPGNTIYLAARSAARQHPRVATVRQLLKRAAAGWST